jgi:hypothetical protein
MSVFTDFNHVLEWLPGWLLEGGGDGWWGLQTWDDFIAGTPNGTYGFYPDPMCQASQEELAAWAGTELGFPVELAPSSQELLRPGRRLWRRWEIVPVYHVRAVTA